MLHISLVLKCFHIRELSFQNVISICCRQAITSCHVKLLPIIKHESCMKIDFWLGWAARVSTCEDPLLDVVKQDLLSSLMMSRSFRYLFSLLSDDDMDCTSIQMCLCLYLYLHKYKGLLLVRVKLHLESYCVTFGNDHHQRQSGARLRMIIFSLLIYKMSTMMMTKMMMTTMEQWDQGWWRYFSRTHPFSSWMSQTSAI